LAYLEDPECYAGGSVAIGRVSLAGQNEETKRDTLVLQVGVEALDQHSNTRKNIPWLKTINQSLGIRLNLNGNDTGNRKGLLE
jgi:hypothetical protein